MWHSILWCQRLWHSVQLNCNEPCSRTGFYCNLNLTSSIYFGFLMHKKNLRWVLFLEPLHNGNILLTNSLISTFTSCNFRCSAFNAHWICSSFCKIFSFFGLFSEFFVSLMFFHCHIDHSSEIDCKRRKFSFIFYSLNGLILRKKNCTVCLHCNENGCIVLVIKNEVITFREFFSKNTCKRCNSSSRRAYQKQSVHILQISEFN